jgi:sugar phosphate isomerase/epimerase
MSRLMIGSIVCLMLAGSLLAAEPGRKRAGRARAGAAAQPQWRLAVQAYSFNRFTFFEAVDKAKTLGLKFIEAYPGQALSPADRKIKFDHELPPAEREKVKQKLAEAGVKLINYGVVSLGTDEKTARKVFDFAKDMGIKTIVSEPDPKMMDTLDKLTEEYKINVAIHNHPKPSPYWNPDVLLEAVKGHSKRIGSCADTGHWVRSGLDPLECLKKLDGRIISLHFKDLNLDYKSAKGKGHDELHDVPWGTGASNVEAMLTELKRQGFSGVFSIEYEYNWDNSMPDIAKCVTAFNELAKKLDVKTVAAK